jgi:hypothetical protein
MSAELNSPGAIVDGVFGWLYVIYFALFRS